MAALDSLKKRPAPAGNAALATLALVLADGGALFLDLGLDDGLPCFADLAACGGAALALALGLGLGVAAALGVDCGSACAQAVWGPKAVKSNDKARGAQRFGVDLGGK